jgi:hypothetical protein
MKAKKVLIATPLFKWYLEHGLEAGNIYQTVEFDLNNKPFKTFVDKDTNARRAGDKDPNKSILALTSKLIGNSSYGSTLLRKQFHKDVIFSNNTKKNNNFINNKHFISLTELDDGYCELNMLKKSILMNVPITIGFLILNMPSYVCCLFIMILLINTLIDRIIS